MRNHFNILLKVIFLFTCNFSVAQIPEINSKSDLPVLNFSTEVFKTGDTSLINQWIRKAAASELIFADSILNNYNVKDSRIKGGLLKRKVFCEFISMNWDNLKYSDTIKIQSSPFGNDNFTDLGSFARSQLQYAEAGDNFRKLFITNFSESIKDMKSDDKMRFTGSVIKKLGEAQSIYDTEMKKFSELKTIGDTSLLPLFQSYVYLQFGNEIKEGLEKYITKSISDSFTRSDSLRGTLSPERAWWDVQRYDIIIKPDPEKKSISGSNEIRYKVVKKYHPLILQIDLQEPMRIDSIFLNKDRMDFKRDGNAWFIPVKPQKNNSNNSLLIYFHGIPHEAAYPPWDGGWIWKKDSLGNPWISVACQGIGASLWYPCKDHQSDEPDKGASLTVTVPDGLTAIANGRLVSRSNNSEGTVSYNWKVVNPINNYNLVPYIGKYINFKDEYKGEKGNIDIDCWVLDYNLERAKRHMIPEIKRMLEAFEYWMGPYPFYEDGYKLIEAPHAGMEHQSAIAYGNKFQNGFWGMDMTGTGWGKKWDYILVHESGHEWFGNNITSTDIADMWIQEGFTTYSEILFTEYWYGKAAAAEYNTGIRKVIQNNFPLIGFYGVNDDLASRSSDMYQKGATVLHSIRNSIDDDEQFREVLRDLTETFYHSTVTSKQIEDFVNENSGFDFSKVFDQYLRTVQIPVFEYFFSKDKNFVSYRYSNCINGFDLPLVLKNKSAKLKIYPGQEWKKSQITPEESGLFNETSIEKLYYIVAKEIKEN